MSKADDILTWTQGKIAKVEEKVGDLNAKLDAKGTEVATLGEQLRQTMGKEELTKADIQDIASKVATTPSLWKLVLAHWDEFLILIATLLAGGKLTAGSLKVFTRTFHAKGRELLGPRDKES